jgi:hypothetical protein
MERKRWCDWMENLEQQNETCWAENEKWEHAGSWVFPCNVWREVRGSDSQNGPDLGVAGEMWLSVAEMWGCV